MLAVLPDGSFLASCGSSIYRHVQRGGSLEVEEYAGHTQAITALAVLPDGTFLSGASRDATVRRWKAGVDEPLETNGEFTSGLAVLSDGSYVR